MFMNKSDDIEFQVFDGTTRNDDYSIAIQKQYNNNSHVVDFDSMIFQRQKKIIH